ncbi:MAG: hypothetical protein WA133_10360 [Syntrophales bacterium]
MMQVRDFIVVFAVPLPGGGFRMPVIFGSADPPFADSCGLT